MRVPLKVQLFTWRDLNYFKVSANFLKRVIRCSMSCPVCGGHETLTHALIDCPRVRKLWKNTTSCCSKSLEFFFSCWDSLSKRDREIFGVICTLIWKAQNEVVHEFGEASLEGIVAQATSCWLHEYQRVCDTPTAKTKVETREPGRWSPR